MVRVHFIQCITHFGSIIFLIPLLKAVNTNLFNFIMTLVYGSQLKTNIFVLMGDPICIMVSLEICH